MNLPNKITLFRVILLPFFAVILLVDKIPFNNFIALALFCIACFSDYLDGHLARKYNLVTDFGKFMDPLADKLLVSTAMIILVEFGKIPSWVVVVIIAREFIISGFRLVAVEKGVVIAASYIAKFKTVCQMFMCIFMLFTCTSKFDNWFFDFVEILAVVFMWLALVLTVVSLIDYMYKNRGVISDK